MAKLTFFIWGNWDFRPVLPPELGKFPQIHLIVTRDVDPPGVPDLRVVVDGGEAVEAGLGGVEAGEEDGVVVTSLLQDTVRPATQCFFSMEPTHV